MKAKKQLFGFKKKLDNELKRFLDQKLQESEQIDSSLKKLVEVVKDIVLRGGKRLRPAFVYYAYQACGGKEEKAILYTAQAVEFLHTMALIHDDIIDQASLRRGQPTAHQLLGEPGAILAGDLSFVFADEVFTHSPFEDGVVRKARAVYDLLREEVIDGQYLDVFAPEKGKMSEKEIIKILKYKSGKYTVERPLHLGAALAGAPLKTFQVFSDYGLPLGIAFQIQDDILGLFGKEKETGKPIDSDLKEGKRTLLVAKTLEKLKRREKIRFLNILGNKKITRKEVIWAQKLIKETGALVSCQNLAKTLSQKAKAAIKESPFQADGKDFLLGMADYLIERRL
jgi:geranylgeranyl diphosphate synthase type I